MSFTSTFPTNTIKFSYVVVVPTTIGVSDFAKGYEAVSLRVIASFDASAGVDTSRVGIPVADTGYGSELLRLIVSAIDRGLGGELVPFMRKEDVEVARGSDTVSMRRIGVVDVSRGVELGVPTQYTVVHPRDALVACLQSLDALYPGIGYEMEVRAVHFNQPIECIRLALSLVSYELQKLARVGVRLEDEVYDEVRELWSKVMGWRGLRAMDILMHEHENEIIDMLVGLEKIYKKLLRYRFLRAGELGLGSELARYKDLTPVVDRLVYKPIPIEYYTDRLSPAGGYVLTPPPVAFKEAYTTHFIVIAMLIYNRTQGTRILWSDVWQGKPSCYVYVYSDSWVVAWFEDRVFTTAVDWDYNDVAVGARVEVLDGAKYVHFIVLDQEHRDTVRGCVTVGGAEYCSGDIGSYSGAVRVVYEAWIPYPS